jgi:hypothetical protein
VCLPGVRELIVSAVNMQAAQQSRKAALTRPVNAPRPVVPGAMKGPDNINVGAQTNTPTAAMPNRPQ